MSIDLEMPVHIGEFVIATICKSDVAPWRGAGCLTLAASKQPVAIILGHGAEILAFRPSGAELPLADLSTLCPDAIEKFRDYLSEMPRPQSD